MKTWRVSSTNPSTDSLREAAAALRAGNLVAFPTETVYGLGANALNEAAVQRIFAAKGRPADNPLIVHIADPSQLAQVVADVTAIPPAVQLAIRAFWPGPLTIILPAHPDLAPAVHPGMTTVGVRMPNHPVAQRLIRLAGCPVAAPSANKSGKPSPTAASDVLEDMEGEFAKGDGVVDGGACEVGVESTVIAVERDRVVIYRPGGISREQLEDALGMSVVLDPHLEQSLTSHSAEASFAPRSPGMKYRHYAPNAKVHVWWGNESRVRDCMEQFARSHAQEEIAIVTRTPLPDFPPNTHRWSAVGESPGEQSPVRAADLTTAFGAPYGGGESGSGEESGRGLGEESGVESGRESERGRERWPDDVSKAAYPRILSRELYRLLREFDRLGAAHILIEGVEPTGLGLAVMNRLSKASEGRMEKV